MNTTAADAVTEFLGTQERFRTVGGIARETGVSRETVSRVLRSLEAGSQLEIDRSSWPNGYRIARTGDMNMNANSGRRWAIRARKLDDVTAGRTDGSSPFRFYLTFADADGLAAVHGRDVLVTMDGHEAASLIGSIPASRLDDNADMQAVARVMALLRRLAAGPGEAAR